MKVDKKEIAINRITLNYLSHRFYDVNDLIFSIELSRDDYNTIISEVRKRFPDNDQHKEFTAYLMKRISKQILKDK